MRKILLLLTLIILSVSVASAANITFKTTAVRSDIDSGETGQFLITLTSSELTIKEYRMYSPSIEWDVPEQIIKAYVLINNFTIITILRIRSKLIQKYFRILAGVL